MKMTELQVFVIVMMAMHTVSGKGRERPVGWVPPNKARNVDPLLWGDCSVPCGGGKRQESTREWTISCHNLPCLSPLKCSCGDTDLLFIMDNTGSITQRHFWMQKQFTVDISKGLQKHGVMGKTSVAAITFDNSTVISFDFGDGFGFSEMDRLEDKLWNIPKRNGHTNTAEALRMALTMFNAQQSSRKKVAILLTDGASNIDKHKTIPNAARLHAAGIGLFVIGIGDINDEELNGIASNPTKQFKFYVTTYGVMEAIVASVMEGLCCVVPPPDCTVVSRSSCSKDCDGGITDVVSNCIHYGFGGVRVKTETVMEQIPCNVDPCPATVTCPDLVKERLVGDRWKLQCSCHESGEAICVEADPTSEPVCGTKKALGCGYKGDWHEPGSNWVQSIDGGRQKACFCPEVVPEDWKLQDYCVALCIFEGKHYYDGDTFNYQENDATIHCRCSQFSSLKCKVQEIITVKDSTDADKGCYWRRKWHDPGSQWVESVNKGRKKVCTCPDPVPDSFHMSSHCHAICMVGQVLYHIGDTWSVHENGVEKTCRCKYTGQKICYDS